MQTLFTLEQILQQTFSLHEKLTENTPIGKQIYRQNHHVTHEPPEV